MEVVASDWIYLNLQMVFNWDFVDYQQYLKSICRIQIQLKKSYFDTSANKPHRFEIYVLYKSTEEAISSANCLDHE